jgi:two-component system nitrogen regulation response regulator GlnG/two-component system response regulator HydG
MHDTTAPERPTAVFSPPPAEAIIGLVCIWHPHHPDAIGHWIPVAEGTWIFGRGGALAEDTHPRVPVIRQRPGANLTLPAFQSPALSRVQLIVKRHANQRELLIENAGQLRLCVNGREMRAASVGLNDVVELGSQLACLCTTRPERLPGEPAPAHPYGEPDVHGLVGESPAAWRVRAEIAFAGPRQLHVLVRGDSGTGKELVARALHERSERRGAFVARNAATLPETLVDAELFGNAEGYPNPSMRERKGLVGAADRGTLFLDEIAELPESQQTHFLRVLDAGEYQRLGETSTRRSDLRVVAATNQPLSALRDDVVARFGFTIHVPDLRARREDIPLLVRHTLRSIGKENPALAARFFDGNDEPRISQHLIRDLVANPPADNVRGLRSLLWRALAESQGDTIELSSPSQTTASAGIRGDERGADERTRVQSALNANAGSVEKTWRVLGLPSRFALMRLMKKYGIRVTKRASDRT